MIRFTPHGKYVRMYFDGIKKPSRQAIHALVLEQHYSMYFGEKAGWAYWWDTEEERDQELDTWLAGYDDDLCWDIAEHGSLLDEHY